jgi:hypothetical protein
MNCWPVFYTQSGKAAHELQQKTHELQGIADQQGSTDRTTH